MKRKTGLLIFLAIVVFGSTILWLARSALGPVEQSDMPQLRIYAYRDWQSVDIRVHPDDIVRIRARGRWLYTPGEYHGPEGHKTYRSPNTYPINAVPGGILIGRYGESGSPFYIGGGGAFQVDREGYLYLRINDDILSDNEGYITVEIEVTRAEE